MLACWFSDLAGGAPTSDRRVDHVAKRLPFESARACHDGQARKERQITLRYRAHSHRKSVNRNQQEGHALIHLPVPDQVHRATDGASTSISARLRRVFAHGRIAERNVWREHAHAA